MYPDHLRYGREHAWLKIEGENKGRVGITYHFQEQLKNIVFVELPGIGAEVTQMEPFGVIESSKATSDLYSPVSGRVIGVNNSLESEPNPINRDPYGQGWMIELELAEPEEISSLLSAKEYMALIGEQNSL